MSHQERESSDEIATLASHTMTTPKPDWMPQKYFDEVVLRLAGSVMSQARGGKHGEAREAD